MSIYFDMYEIEVYRTKIEALPDFDKISVI